MFSSSQDSMKISIPPASPRTCTRTIILVILLVRTCTSWFEFKYLFYLVHVHVLVQLNPAGCNSSSLFFIIILYKYLKYIFRELLYVTLKKLIVTLYIYSSSFFVFFEAYAKVAKNIIFFLTLAYKNDFLI